MRSLNALFNQYGCDRGAIRHGYAAIYGTLPAPARMLEVGVKAGAGLSAWLEYWPRTHFVVVDNFEPDSVPTVLKHPRVEWKKADSQTVKIDGSFDLIIDDGAHDPLTQRLTFENLFPRCDGRYFIEDVFPMDDMTPAQMKKREQWFARGWLDRRLHTRDNYDRLLKSINRFTVTRHDLRAGHNADSFLFEITR
jgi:hypothetical protein